MDRKFFIVVAGSWLMDEATHEKRMRQQHLCPLGEKSGGLAPDCRLLVKLRDDGRLRADDAAHIERFKDRFFVKSPMLCEVIVQKAPRDVLVAFFFDGTPSEARCIVQFWPPSFLEDVAAAYDVLRPESFDLPPVASTLVDADHIIARLYQEASRRDAELFAVHASAFLSAPHILVPLCAHIMSLRSEDNATFPVQLKKVAEQLRGLLLEHGKSVGIVQMQRSHLNTWSSAQGCRIAFLDGGVARLQSLAGLEPMALRVGVYAVRPGERDTTRREEWSMTPFLIADMLDATRHVGEATDKRRLMEAARFVAEPLAALSEAQARPDTKIVLLHGPLVNQFVQYDEDKPHYIPFLDARFLARWGVTREAVETTVKDLPSDGAGESMWNQFMAVYGFVMRSVADSPVPLVGVVERIAGRAVATAVLEALLEDKAITKPYVQRVRQILERFDISDDFLFGCILREGEYVTPLAVRKNLPHRARDRWQPVVAQYPTAFATMVKTEESRFPFRVELNAAGSHCSDWVLGLVYHTARLLPRYAFPVGLDIADKYARIPDWIARGVSDEIAAVVLRRALRLGDAKLVGQVKELLARTPRDFFFRPGSDVIRSR